MAPSTDTKPTFMRGAFFSSLIYFTTLFGLSCSDTEPQVIARFPAVSAAGTGSTAGATDVAGGGGGGLDGGTVEAGDGAGDAGTGGSPSSIPPQRGRVKVVAGKIVTDLGTPLRGVLLPVDTGWALDDFNFLHTLAATTGLNAVHVYLENSTLVVGSNQDAADALVALAAEEGLYVIIGYGTGDKVGMVDSVKLKAFWTKYAARYGDRSHVLFEIQNNPESNNCKTNFKPETLAIERSMYALIRSLAPDTHVLLFSTTSIVQPSVFTDAVTHLGSTVDWTNASFALGITSSCVLAPDFSTVTAAAKAAGVPLLINQLPTDAWAPFLQVFEQSGVGWFQFRWFATQKETLASFDAAITAAGSSWCPERGTFPTDSATCR